MNKYNELYEKMIDQADYERFKDNLSYTTGTLGDLQYSYNNTTKCATIKKTSVLAPAGFKVTFPQLKLGDILVFECEVYNKSSAKLKLETNEQGYLKAVYSSKKSDDWETFTVQHVKRWNSNFEVFLGFLKDDVGEIVIRNVSVKVLTITKPLHAAENIKRYLICKKPQGQFELRADFANDTGTFSLTDDFTMQIWFGTQFVNKRPVVIVSESGYNESIKYRPRAFDVQKNFVTIKLFDKNDVAVNLTTLATGEYIFINVLCIDELTLL
ncbi:hypothetical protein [Enterococcus dispar]|uniref:hypothetical protein n=1 Tax=Enterococcus dispar TaxID=44009 RepID=UPI00288D4137|nr:hypothetical protein [Enterococcus dispar]MDT2705756.1 hypothetical protein [Enterococcus dispar]